MTDPLSPTPLTERERRLVSDARELAPSNPDYRLRLTERGREVRRLHRPTRRQCARIGLDWVDGNA